MKKQILISLCVTLCLLFALSSCSAFCKHEYAERVVPSTCVAEGYTEYTCTKCGESYKENFQPVIQHYFLGGPCTVCGMQEITESITPSTEWYNSETEMFTLTTKEELAGLAALVNSGTSFANKTVYLGADIDLGYYEWIPIGNADNAFAGKFDADGHTISSLKINAQSNYAGLFGNSKGQILNLNVNNASIFSSRYYKYISIVCGYTTHEMTNVTARGFIDAAKADYVGAIAGATSPGEIIYSKLINHAAVKGANYVGGIIGEVNTGSIVQTDKLTNMGDVTGTSHVGGIFGYTNAKAGSSIYNAASNANIVGDYYVGGIVGKAVNVGISHCSNEGSTITANSYFAEGSNFYVWLGGYAGYGYSVEDCTNNASIMYSSRGAYVGGIIGYATNTMRNCTNNASITSYANDVGGIAGHIELVWSENAYRNLTNNGNVSGKDNVGGIVGNAYRSIRDSGLTPVSKMNTVYNNANVTGENCVGGLFGLLNCDNTAWYQGYSINIFDAGNAGTISGVTKCGEIFGSFWSAGDSNLTNYTVTGKIVINNEPLEGEYDVGSQERLTLADRKVAGK